MVSKKDLKRIIHELIIQQPQDKEALYAIIRANMPANTKEFPKKSDLIQVYHEMCKRQEIIRYPYLEKILQKKAIRTLSGVAVVAILVKPAPCPANCVYCPTEKGVPKSYLSNEPAVMRAIMFNWDPYAQVRGRIRALEINGHDTDKIELIIIGGTWSSYPKKYQEWFIKRCFDACNSEIKIKPQASENIKEAINHLAKEDQGSINLETAQKINETAKHRIVGLSLETRPDCISWQEIKRMRRYGCTRIEMGLQSTEDKVLKIVRRGHTTNKVIEAIKKLKDAGFKITLHMMPGLPGATPNSDIEGFKKLFNGPYFQPDQLKIYPTVVVKEAELYQWVQSGKYKPYSDEVLFNTLLEIKKTIPPYTRIVRLIRDIPTTSITDGNKVANLRQMLQEELKKLGNYCKCTRCREARSTQVKEKDIKLKINEYLASDGKEFFLEFTSKDEKILYAFCRLRIPSWYYHKQTEKDQKLYQLIPELKDAALLRELHTYGRLAPLKGSKKSNVQHLGFGKRLMQKAEEIAKNHGFKKIAVISGVGVRKYYEKLGYHLEGSYMVKEL